MNFINEWLAPLAGVANANQIDGTLIAANFAGGGGSHRDAITGTSPPTPTPEPPSALIVGTGPGILGAIRTKRR